MQRRRHGIGQARGAEEIAEGALEHQREAEGEQQSIEMIELVEPLQEEPLDDDSGHPHDEGRDDDRPPITQPGILQQEERGEGAQHVLGAMGEIDDVEHAEDDGEPEAEQRIERAVDEPDQQLPEQGLGADAEQFEHGRSPSCGEERNGPFPDIAARSGQLFTNGQPPSASGRKASSAGMVARTL